MTKTQRLNLAKQECANYVGGRCLLYEECVFATPGKGDCKYFEANVKPAGRNHE